MCQTVCKQANFAYFIIFPFTNGGRQYAWLIFTGVGGFLMVYSKCCYWHMGRLSHLTVRGVCQTLSPQPRSPSPSCTRCSKSCPAFLPQVLCFSTVSIFCLTSGFWCSSFLYMIYLLALAYPTVYPFCCDRHELFSSFCMETVYACFPPVWWRVHTMVWNFWNTGMHVVAYKRYCRRIFQLVLPQAGFGSLLLHI